MAALRRSRRELLVSLGAGALALGGCGRREEPASSLASAAPSRGPEAAAPRGPRVAVARSDEAITGSRVREDVVGELLDAAMRSFTGQEGAAAWRQLFGAGDVVAIKVNCLGGPQLRTHPELVAHIVRGLESAGVARTSIIIYDRMTSELRECGFEVRTGGAGPLCYGTDEVGYDGEPSVVRSVGTCFSRIVSQGCNAIINVPVLKDHDLAGLSGALKNHFGSIHNPNKLHLDRCTPYIADLNCAAVLRDKQRLIVYDGLLACYDGGPAFKADTTAAYGAVAVATDPVAADTVALDMLEKLRGRAGLPPLTGGDRAPQYLALAGDADRKLGTADLAEIEVLAAV